jgi:(1->4)-alpha-D-glucan 1-alpha-D-glucosylmutase
VLLSEIPREWERRVTLWARLNRLRRGEVDGEPAPDRNDEYFFYQTVVGAWPLDLEPGDAGRVAGFCERVQATMTKAVREAKEQSSWSNPNAGYEAMLGRFVAGALEASRPNPFLQDMCGFVQTLARPGAINSLSQALIRLTAPGVPDTYQGNELWDFSLVDPDNRRPVDWQAHAAALRETAPSRRTLKAHLINRTLHLRAEHPDAFEGSYEPLDLGPDRVGFVRGGAIRVVVPLRAGDRADGGDRDLLPEYDQELSLLE